MRPVTRLLFAARAAPLCAVLNPGIATVGARPTVLATIKYVCTPRHALPFNVRAPARGSPA